MKNEKIYSSPLGVIDSLYYCRQLEDNDKVDADCCIRHGDTWATISKDSMLIGRTVKEIQEAVYLASNKLDVVIAKRFDNNP